MEPIWRMKVYDPDGLYKFVQDMGSLKLDGSPVMEVEPSGNCRECTFSGQVPFGPRDLVIVEASLDGAQTWQAHFSGIAVQCRTGYNLDAGGYKLVGLMKKLEEAEVRTTLQPGNLREQVKTFMRDLLGTGQLGSLFSNSLTYGGTQAGNLAGAVLDALAAQVDVSDVPATLTGRGIIPNFQKAAEILKTIIAPQYAGSQVAITADRQLKLAKPGGLLILDERNPDVHVQWTDIEAEELVSHVRFIFQRTVGGTVTYGESRRDAPAAKTATAGVPASVLVPAFTDTPNYGTSIKPLALSSSEDQHFIRQAHTGDVTFDVTSYLNTRPTVTATGAESALYDGKNDTSVVFQMSNSNAGGFSLRLTFPSLPDLIGVEAVVDGAAILGLSLSASTASYYVRVQNPSAVGGLMLLSDEVRAWMAQYFGAGPLTVTLLLGPSASNAITVHGLCLLSPDRVRLGGVAQAAGRGPAVQAGTITVPGWVDPVANIQIQRRDERRQAAVGDPVTVPAAMFRYSVTGAGELQTEISIGQRDTPEQSAAAALIKGRDAQATLNAIRVFS